MAITTDAWDSTELAAYISENWPGMTLEEYFAKSAISDFALDMSEFAQEGSDIFNIPDVYTNAFSVQTQSTQGAEVTTDAPAAATVQLTVNSHKYIATLLGHKDQVQIDRSYNLNEIYTRKAGGTLMEDFEDALFALWSDISTNTVGDTATVLADAEIRQGIEKLASSDIPLEESAFFFHTYTYFNQILSVQKYYDASQFGKGNAVTSTGNFTGTNGVSGALKGNLYGLPAYVSSRVVSGLQTHRNILAHKTAFAFAHQTPGGDQVRMMAQEWLANLGILTVWETIYGVKTIRESAAVLLNSSNAFIGS